MSVKRGDVTKRLALVLYCSLFNSALEQCLVSGTLASGTAVNFNDTKVQTHLESLVHAAQSCVVKVRAGPKDVRAYFTNTSPLTHSGQCFVACMMEQSQIITRKKINRQHLVYSAGLINGRDSRVVDKLTSVSRMCTANVNPAMDHCLYASAYNDCLNENMMEFAFPVDVAEEAISKMPFHMVHPNLPKNSWTWSSLQTFHKTTQEEFVSKKTVRW